MKYKDCKKCKECKSDSVEWCKDCKCNLEYVKVKKKLL